ncbi:N-acetyltransferase [Aureimonas sp. SA4125]|uniref:GNAT family N-acetyltransferase n=1 Tax=Aureimonas sp. SA4125 TaxID=2826993 RepID=UPI001CC672D3|nr:GNAT family N-acetyltransferase [Aureimonas sp. SA4125]BDA86731.1 N-acetyltransferase [Aureimonas sp. SA4125]
MHIRHEATETGGRFLVSDVPGAELIYLHPRPRTIVIDHTFVPETRRGEGTGETLVAAAVDYARRMGLQVDPRCPFAQRKFARHADWQSLLAK